MLGWFSGTLVSMISMHLHRIEELADRDWLTGLITERRFYDRAPDLIQLVNREKGVCCLAEIEVDPSSSSTRKQMRDFHHLTLKTLADVIKASIRQTDISARVNDNTIAIFMPFAELDQAHRLIGRVNKRISQTVLFNDNKPFTITVSTGIHQLDIDEEIDSAFHRTHQALVAAQTNGGNQISTANVNRHPVTA
jgi:diguanylate cyclase (GGDEF)-like protein